jgi:iron complex transport system substrate-binding protein
VFFARVAVACCALAAASASSACAKPDSLPASTSTSTNRRTSASAGALASAPIALVDDFGDTLRSAAPAQRIASLNPTTTEIVYAIGAGGRVVGRTTWDTYPDSARLAPDLGPGLRPNVEAIIAAKPDLVLLYASADNRGAAQALRAAGLRTLTLRIDKIADFARATRLIGRATGDSARAESVIDSVQATIARVRRAVASAARPTVAWRLYDAPLLVAGGGSFLSELIDIAGGRNVYADLKDPSPQVSLEDLVRRDPDLLLGGPDAATRLAGQLPWRAVRAVREGHLVSPDTALIGRPAVRLGEAAVSIAHLLHPELRIR